VVEEAGFVEICGAWLPPTAQAWLTAAQKGPQKGRSCGWKIIDVYYGATSQVTTRRSKFAGAMASGGPIGLLTHLDTLTAKLVR
jgi:ABC-type transporter MlaC component